MREILFIILMSTFIFVSEMVGYKQGWWKSRLFYLLFFGIGAGSVFTPLFPFKVDNIFMNIFFSLLFGVFFAYGHYVMVNYWYKKLEVIKR